MQGQLPAGWATHPQAPGYVYELANPRNVQLATEVAQQPVLPAPPAPPAQGTTAADPFAGYTGQGADVETWLKQHESAVRQTMGWTERDKNLIFIDFKPGNQMAVGEECAITIRLMPDLKHADQRDVDVPVSRHRMMTSYVPDFRGDKQWVYIPCYDNIDGPGECNICKALEDSAASSVPGVDKHLANFKPRTTTCWKCILLDDPTKHYVQVMDSSGQPEIDPHTRQPVWKMVPGIIRMGRSMQIKLKDLIRHQKFPFDPRTGYPLLLIKKKTGPEQFNVEYNVIHQAVCPIDPQLYPIFHNDIDLRKEMLTDRYWRREDMVAIGNKIREKAGLGGAPGAGSEQWLPHSKPGWEYNPTTMVVRPVQAAQPQPSPPVAGPPSMAYPPPGPGAMPPRPASPELGALPPMPAPPAAAGPPVGLPPGLPPLGAPGLPPGGMPVALPPPPPPPGMPPGTAPQVAPGPPPPPPALSPPPAAGPPVGGMTPEQLEASLGAPPQLGLPGGPGDPATTGETPF